MVRDIPRREEVDEVARQRPTNERLGELLDELLTEVRQLRDGQEQLTAEVRRLARSSRS